MSPQQGFISRTLEFVGRADHSGNIVGRPSYRNQVVWYDDFTGKAIDTTYDYTVNGVNSGACTITVPHCLTLTTGAADDDDTEFAMGVDFYPYNNIALEARFRIDDVDMTAINIGFSDLVQGASADTIQMTMDGTTLTSNASNFAGFLFDADADNAYIYGVSVNADADGTDVYGTTEASDAKWFTVRIEMRDDGTNVDAIFYVNTSGKEIAPNDDMIGMEIAAVARTTALCPYIALINHGEDAANTLDVDYLKVWSDRQ